MKLRNLIGASLLFAAAPTAATPSIGEAVTDATFTTAYGQSLSMGDLKGEVVILTYWMRDCEACDAQVKMLDYYYRQRRNVGLRVLAIAAEDLPQGQLQYAFRDKIVHPIASIRGPFEPTNGLPTTYVVDRHGQVRFVESGLIDIDRLNQVLVPLLRQPQP